MRWKYYPLADRDPAAKQHIFMNLSVGVHEQRPLAVRLAVRLSEAAGPMFAIAMESLDLDRASDYQWAGTYSGGKQLREAITTPFIPVGDRSIDGLMSFLQTYLDSVDGGLVVMENYLTTKSERAKQQRSNRGIRFYQDSVYHVLMRDDRDPEFIEDTIREWRDPWCAGVCAANIALPEGDDWSEQFLDDVAANTQHIFVPAFDGEGFLVWSPVAR